MAAPQIHQKYITIYSRGESVLIVKLQKALYEMLKSALLFYRKLLTDLSAQGFMVNTTIRGKQMTICWHVDNLKMPDQDHMQVTRVEKWLMSIFGNASMSRGKR